VSINTVGLILLAKGLALSGADGVFAAPFAREFPVPVGEKWFTGLAELVGFERDSNNSYPVVDYTNITLYHLPDPADAYTYMLGEMAADLSLFMNPATLGGIAGTVEIRQPRLSRPPTRIGDVIEYETITPIVLESVS